MKRFSTTFAAFSFLFATMLFSQTYWIKYENNPVFDVGVEGAWDEYAVRSPSIVYHNGIYHMWYESYSISVDTPKTGIGYAFSSNGVAWSRYEGNPVLRSGGSGSWEREDGIAQPNVVFDGLQFHMWYYGYETPVPGQRFSEGDIGHATSPDGMNWTKDSQNPVIKRGETGSWYEVSSRAPSVIFAGSLFKMWFEGYGNEPHREGQVGYAVSSDGTSWSINTAPVMSGCEGEESLKHISVLYHNEGYHMWYTAFDNVSDIICYATSPDGITWIKSDNNPVLEKSESGWDSSDAGYCSVLYEPSTEQFKLWYSGTTYHYYPSRIGYALSDDLTSIDNSLSDVPRSFRLYQNYPNPFNPATTISYSIPELVNSELSIVNLTIYDVLGKEVATLVNEHQRPGSYQVNWDASGQASGIYFYTLTAGQFINSRKMILLK